ncbi:restriction endonuclease subunit S [Vibrio harveyi]|nr:restriction endonuclease subunit S [Vibrio harveyi]
MTLICNSPQLRFSEFNDQWSVLKLGNIAKINDGTHQTPRYVENGIKFVSVENIHNLKSTSKFITSEAYEKGFKVKPRIGDILMTRITAGVIGATAIVTDNEPLAYYVSLALIREVSGNHIPYLAQRIESTHFKRELHKRIIHVAFPKKINLGDIGECLISIPSHHEQQKIASFLSKVDEKIALLTKRKGKLTEYKKGVMQQLFNGKWEEQDGQLTFIPPTLRFKADDGSEFPDWEEKKLGQVFTRIRRKNKENNQNVLTISAQQGLINQEKYFNKSVAAKDVTGYYLLENGDFAYNKSYSKGYPMGAIKRLNNYDKGVVSTLYICFGLNQGFVSDFFEHYFESGLQNRDLSKIAQEGARNHGLLNISVDEFFKDVKLLTPSHDEQLKIANFLSTIDQKIDIANLELEKAKKWKKGLLQQMFV